MLCEELLESKWFYKDTFDDYTQDNVKFQVMSLVHGKRRGHPRRELYYISFPEYFFRINLGEIKRDLHNYTNKFTRRTLKQIVKNNKNRIQLLPGNVHAEPKKLLVLKWLKPYKSQQV